MNYTAKIVACVQVTTGVTLDRVAAITGVPKDAARKLLFQVTKRGQFVKDAEGGYSLNAEYVPYQRKSGKASLREGKRARQPTPMVDAAPNIGRLLVEHAQATFESLKHTLDLTDAEPSTVAAFNVHAQALRLLGGGV